jgi:hypothetical protein
VLREVVGNVKQELQKYVKYLPTREGYQECGYGNDQVRNVDLATIVGAANIPEFVWSKDCSEGKRRRLIFFGGSWFFLADDHK